MAVAEQLKELLTQNKKCYSLIMGQSGEVLKMMDDERVLVECFKSKYKFVMRIPKSGFRIMETDGVYFLETTFYEELKARSSKGEIGCLRKF